MTYLKTYTAFQVPERKCATNRPVTAKNVEDIGFPLILIADRGCMGAIRPLTVVVMINAFFYQILAILWPGLTCVMRQTPCHQHRQLHS